MPPRRPTRGRHRRRASTSLAPTYFTVATVAAFTVSGLNVPNAIGAARQGSRPAAKSGGASSLRSAQELRRRIATQDATRISRLRSARSEALQGAAESARRAKLAAEKTDPAWVLPVLHYRLTAGFGETGLWSNAHTGQDFAAPTGTPVRAVGNGRIIFASFDGPYGNKVVVEHPDGTVTWYAHMSAFVRTDGEVKAGDVIGRVGSTGNTTGPHLHFEVRPGGGAPIPPLAWLAQHHIKY